MWTYATYLWIFLLKVSANVQVQSSFSVIGFRYYRFHRITRELKKIQQQKFTRTDFHVAFMSCMLPSELIPLFAGSSSPLDPHVVILYWFQKSLSQRIKRAWLHKDVNCWDFQQIGELAQIVACRTWMSEESQCLGSLPGGGKILLLDFFISLMIL